MLWIFHTRRAVNAVIQRCLKCKRFNEKSCEVPTPALPVDRVKDAAAFEVIGVDLAGPLYLVDKKKVWLVLFTCAVYRGVHLELVTSLDTSSFLQSFRRFIARRGRPSIVYSDNGRNFLGAVNLLKSVNWDQVQKSGTVENIKWIFNCPTAAWWGGFFERMVRSVKGLLLRMLGKSVVNYEELLTLLCDVESVMNNRPLTYVTESGSDLVPLTPSMFFQGVRVSGVPDLDVLDKEGFERRFRCRQELLVRLRGRFRKEYLALLVGKFKDQKWEVQVGDVVFIQDDTKRKINWQLGRVAEIIPGKDSIIRVAKVQIEIGYLTRPVQRLIPTEVRAGDSMLVKHNLSRRCDTLN